MGGKLAKLEKQLNEAQAASAHAMLREEVTDQDIAGVVSRWTGIPVGRMVKNEVEAVLKLADTLGNQTDPSDRPTVEA